MDDILEQSQARCHSAGIREERANVSEPVATEKAAKSIAGDLCERIAKRGEKLAIVSAF